MNAYQEGSGACGADPLLKGVTQIPGVQNGPVCDLILPPEGVQVIILGSLLQFSFNVFSHESPASLKVK